jgi:glycosyltransferase involved in cell wall biosynthesis
MGRRGSGATADVVVYAPFGGSLYSPDGVSGGAEIQAFTLARELARAGLRVRHVVASAPVAASPDGVELLQLPPDYHRRGLPRRRAIVSALREADGHVYVQRSAGIETGFVGVFARAARRRAIFSASSDADFMRDTALLRQIGGSLELWPVRAQYRLGLRAVHEVVAQTKQQAELAERNFGLVPHVVPSFSAPVGRAPGERDAALWIGSLTDVKDPLTYLELAERTPEVTFRMVVHEHPTGWPELAADVRRRAQALPNVELLERRPRAELLDLYDRAIAVVNTSVFEGFPNTFLEAWSRGVPAVSLRIDPDGVIAAHRLGTAAAGSVDAAAAALRRYAADPEAAQQEGETALEFIRATHAPAIVVQRWLEVVERLKRRA